MDLIQAITLVTGFMLINSVSSEFCNRVSPEPCTSSHNIVTVATGQLAGNSIKFQGKVIYEFLGIPYAQTPAGDLRFLNPKRLTTSWTGIRDASRYGPACMRLPRLSESDSEDCLYLNIWTSKKGSGSKQVMVYIHGGSFNMDTASRAESNGTVLAAMHDVVVVTANFRLGFFGNLFTNDGINSNMAERDQQVVVEWVRENVHQFGGDAEHITVFGTSSGGISAGILSLSPLTNRLLDRAILQSGTPYSFLRPDSLPVAQTKSYDLSQFLNCTRGPGESLSSAHVLRCLQAAPAELILSYAPHEIAHSVIMPNPMYGDTFLPFSIPRLLDHELQQSRLKPIDMVIGFQKDEAETFLMRQVQGYFGQKNREREVSYEFITDRIPMIFNRKLSADEQEKVLKHYFSDGKHMTSDQLKLALIRAYGDLYIYCPSYFMAQKMIESSDCESQVFMYEVRSKASIANDEDCEHVCHHEEVKLVFGEPFLHPELYDEGDRQLSEQVMNHWTQFAKNGNPDKKWISFNRSQKYLLLQKGGDEGEMSDEKFENCDSFWKAIFDARK